MPPPIPVDTGIVQLEERIGLRPGFVGTLYDEDDWSFIIKLHALLEAACSHLLAFHFNEPVLSDFFSRLELSGKTLGKTRLLGQLDLLGKEYRRCAAALSELRNNLVHDIRNSEFRLIHYVRSLEPKALREFAISFAPFEANVRVLTSLETELSAGLKAATTVEAMINRVKDNPKLHIWLGAHATLINIVEARDYSDYKQWIKARKFVSDDDDP